MISILSAAAFSAIVRRRFDATWREREGMVSLHTHCAAAPPTHLGFPSPDGFQLRLPLLLTLAKGLNGQLLLIPPPLPPLLAQLVLRHELWRWVALLDGAQHLDFVGIGGNPCSSSVLVPTPLALAFLDINIPCKWRVCQSTASQHLSYSHSYWLLWSAACQAPRPCHCPWE